MYELIQVSECAYYIQSPSKIGVVKTGENEVCLIDSGGDKDAGRKARQILDSQGWRLTAIYNTHSHADHIGGNAYLHAQTGCAIYAPGIEQDFTRHPILEPSLLYGGYPPAELRCKFLLAPESPAQPLTENVLPSGWELIPLPGHSFDMVGFRTPDNVVFLADCLSGEDTLDKYRVGFLYDVGQYLATLESVKTMQAACFVPSHAAASSEISRLAQVNIDAVTAVAEQILDLCRRPIGFEDLLQAAFDRYGLTLTFEQYALVGSTIRSYLSWLKESDRITTEICGNRLLWKRT